MGRAARRPRRRAASRPTATTCPHRSDDPRAQAGPPQDPWSSPTTRATFPTGQQAWGTPVDTIGGPVKAPRKSRRGLGTAAAVLATALVAGSVGGVVGARSGDDARPARPVGLARQRVELDREPEPRPRVGRRHRRTRHAQHRQHRRARQRGQRHGSGVVISPDGYILTNNHVVESAAGGGEITVTLDAGEQEIAAEIVGRDPVTDLAVLQVQSGSQLPAATLGESRGLVVGDPVIAIGSPLGLSGTVTTGIVSALNRTVDVPGENGERNPLFNAIQTDAAINPGNSGGALVNARGEVIGINSAIATLGGGGPFGGEQGGSIGVGFAIPIDEARSVAEEIIRTGKATHPSIGVSATTVAGTDDREGALVRELTAAARQRAPGSSRTTSSSRSTARRSRASTSSSSRSGPHQVGDRVEVTYVRDGERRTTEVVLQDRAR